MDRYFLRDIFVFLTYLAAVQWGMYIERSYGCTPAQDVLDFTPRCYSLPIVEDQDILCKAGVDPADCDSHRISREADATAGTL